MNNSTFRLFIHLILLNNNVSADELCRFIMTRGNSNEIASIQYTFAQLGGLVNAENHMRRGSILQLKQISSYECSQVKYYFVVLEGG
ncbi:MAG: hypothetical protein JNM39_11335 [Bdellovibrionaceae bacterium]|nr:hypothetical protein [Pseudobdellovibrionaceae bacterium]